MLRRVNLATSLNKARARKDLLCPNSGGPLLDSGKLLLHLAYRVVGTARHLSSELLPMSVVRLGVLCDEVFFSGHSVDGSVVVVAPCGDRARAYLLCGFCFVNCRGLAQAR